MKLFFRICLGYAVVSLAAIMLVRDVGLDLVVEAGLATIEFATAIVSAVKWALPVLLLLPLVVGLRRSAANLGDLGYALAGSSLFQAAFSLMKSSIPFFVPFYADPPLAALDRMLHGGVDPWIITHRWAGLFPAEWLFPLYLDIWLFPAIGFVVFMALTDRNRDRQMRFVALYFTCWVFLGTVLSLAGASVGPVYYDALLGGSRFGALTAALAASPLAADNLAQVQDYLWASYERRGLALGSGISAFPSVHVGVATMIALYLAERRWWLALPGAGFVAAILFLSVYTGYHYAVDGYFSIVVVVAVWAALRRVAHSGLEPRAPRRRSARRVIVAPFRSVS
ncbi:phosphatase PAP2 family protein [Albidovulum sp.]|uniref:phosphatase PAP2 family protein n=1 Tax=Albidovulum sp. TaxID=1872424 RepID=UPI0039B920A9